MRVLRFMKYSADLFIK